ncbi:hypothetical protein, partial [Mycobacterium paragordonae]|uniref:hypothetical protein n=1 Tax=Mycobacterium paragordonae TaxID=1389713 RepID=UPI001980EE75
TKAAPTFVGAAFTCLLTNRAYISAVQGNQPYDRRALTRELVDCANLLPDPRVAAHQHGLCDA